MYEFHKNEINLDYAGYNTPASHIPQTKHK